MSLFKRLRDITMSSINDLLDKAENPVKMAEQYLRDMADDIEDAEAATAKQIAVERKYKQQVDEARELVNKRQQQAELAIMQNNDELAKKALSDKKIHEERLSTLQEHYNLAKENADLLRKQLDEMKNEFQKMKNTKEMLVARHEAAIAQKSINQALSQYSSTSAVRGMERMEKKVLELEAQAQARSELADRARSLDDEFKELERSSIDDELAQLKAKLGKAD